MKYPAVIHDSILRRSGSLIVLFTVMFASVKLLVVIFSEVINEGVPEIFAPFSRNSVELSGIIVLLEGSTARTEATPLIASDITKITRRITN